MALESINIGDSKIAKPGTSNQTGNHAPKVKWKIEPKGRFGIIFATCIAHHLKYSNERMATQHQFPSRYDFDYFFTKMTPWFYQWYNNCRKTSSYTGRMEPFNGNDAENRVRHQFVEPGRKGHDPKARLYGTTTEFYQSVKQRQPGGLMEVWVRCSEEINLRLEKCIPITEEEAEEWGRR
jgi:hypothetical protein